jgi:hypothetical protein
MKRLYLADRSRLYDSHGNSFRRSSRYLFRVGPRVYVIDVLRADYACETDFTATTRHTDGLHPWDSICEPGRME